MLRIVAAIVALCAIGAFSSWIVLRDNNHWRDGDRRHVSPGALRGALIALTICCIAIGACICSSISAHARPSPYPVTPFEGDRYSARTAQMGADVAKAVKVQRARKAARSHRWRRVPVPRARPGLRQVPIFAPLAVEPLTLYGGAKREAIEAMPLRMLAGVVAPLAAKAREIVANCGSRVISGVRHTYVAGTGGRLSLHASGRAVDIKGNPACIYSNLHGWPGGYSTDYARPNIQHVHISYAPHGPEWGKRFTHFVSARRHRHAKRPRRVTTGPWLSSESLAILSESRIEAGPSHAVGIDWSIDVNRHQFWPWGRTVRPWKFGFVELLDQQDAAAPFVQEPFEKPLAVRRPLLPDTLTEVLSLDRVPEFAIGCSRSFCVAHNRLHVSNSQSRWISIRHKHYSIMGFRTFS